MKISPRTFTIFWEAHGWVGVLSSVVLFAIFFLGPFSLFWKELGPWQERLPEPAEVSTPHLLDLAQREAERGAAQGASRLAIELPSRGIPWMKVQASGADGETQVFWVHPVSGERVAQRSDLGYFLFAMHFLEPIPGGMTLTGIASVVLLFLIATGLTMQLGKVFRELVQFRPERRERVFWADAHKVTGLLGLPFLVVFAWTGALLCLRSWLLPAFVVASFGGDAGVIERAEGWKAPPEPTGESAEAPDLRLLLAGAREVVPDMRYESIVLYHPGDANATADVRSGADDKLSYYTNIRLTREGEVQWFLGPDHAPPRARFLSSFYGIHFAKWADIGLRVIYALLSFFGAFCILSGCFIWLARRGARRYSIGDVILARLLSGGCAGLCFAVAVLFVANRVLPGEMAERAGWEETTFFIAWAGALLYAGLWRSAARSGWHLLCASAALLFAVPLLDALYTGRLPFDPRPLGYHFGVELGLLLLGLLLLAAGCLIRRVQAYTERPSVTDKAQAAQSEAIWSANNLESV